MRQRSRSFVADDARLPIRFFTEHVVAEAVRPGVDERVRVDHDAHMGRAGRICILEEDEVARLRDERFAELGPEISPGPIVGDVRARDVDA